MWPASPASMNSEPHAAAMSSATSKAQNGSLRLPMVIDGKRQRVARIGAERHQVLWADRGVGDIGRRDQEGAGDRLARNREWR